MTHYDETIMLQLVLKEIERLRQVEQGAKWYRQITTDPQTRKTVIEMYETWSQ